MTTITIDADKIIINNTSLEELLQRVYNKGKEDGKLELVDEKVTFIQLAKEMAEKGRKISVQSLTRKAREANVKILQFDGKRKACYRKDIQAFVSV